MIHTEQDAILSERDVKPHPGDRSILTDHISKIVAKGNQATEPNYGGHSGASGGLAAVAVNQVYIHRNFTSSSIIHLIIQLPAS
jgi:hypothetical protein